MVDALPAGVTFISATSSRGLCTAGVFCLLGSMPVGTTATIIINVKVDSSTSGCPNQRGLRLVG